MKTTNYIFLKKSDEPVKEGDLVSYVPDIFGIVTSTNAKGLSFNGKLYTYDSVIKLLPMLIMDAREKPDYWDDLGNSIFDNEIKESIKNNKAIPFKSNSEVWKWLQSKGIKPEADMLIPFDEEVTFIYEKIGVNSTTDPWTKEWRECSEEEYKEEYEMFPRKYRKVAIIKPVQQEDGDPVHELRNHLSPYFTLVGLVDKIGHVEVNDLYKLMRECAGHCDNDKIIFYLDEINKNVQQESEEKMWDEIWDNIISMHHQMIPLDNYEYVKKHFKIERRK